MPALLSSSERKLLVAALLSNSARKVLVAALLSNSLHALLRECMPARTQAISA